jgi:coenzyme F420-0:L-glutamate ligase/coenzyme F420-1:gamma-L-glutamate ligase
VSVCVDPDLVLRDDLARLTGSKDSAGTVLIIPLRGIPLVKPGDDLVEMVWSAAKVSNVSFLDGDILVLAQKVVSKSENAYVSLSSVEPGPQADELARVSGKDPRLMQVVLDESAEVVRVKPGVVITEHRSGFVMANSGVDGSNVDIGDDRVLKLPFDSDESARKVSQEIFRRAGVAIPVVINDSWGRPWRQGTVGHSVGSFGFPALWDRRGEPDLFEKPLKVTQVGLADEIAAAASLVMGAAGEGIPAVILRGYRVPAGSGTAADLIRPRSENLFR